MKYICLLFLLGVLLPTLALWDGENPSSFAEEDDGLDVYLLEGVISYFNKYKKLMEKLHVFHGGVGFVNQRTNETMQCEYYALDFFGAIKPYTNEAKGTVKFNNTAIAICSSPFEEQWKTGEITRVAKMQGSVFAEFHDWMAKYNKTNGEYYLWNIDKSVHGKEWIHGNTCFDFTARAFQKLYECGVRYDLSKEFKSEDAFFYSNEPKLVDYNNPDTRKKIFKFYNTFNITDKTTIEEVFELILLFEEDKFVYNDGKYYLLDLKFPFIEPHYVRRNLPGQ